MVPLILTLLAELLVLVGSDYLYRKKNLKPEYARKIVHVGLGLILAATPWYLSWRTLQIVGTLGMGLVVLIRFSGWFKGFYNIKRVSFGEITYALPALVLAFFEPDKILFTAVVLHVALADGLAAVIGVRFGKPNEYKVFGYTKSLAGTATFFLMSLTIMVSMFVLGLADTNHILLALLLVPLVTTAIENIAVWGIDNLLVSVAVIGLFAVLGISGT